MKYISAFLLLLSIYSCSIEKKLAKYCPLCPSNDSTIIVTKFRDTTITLPGETVFIEDTLFCDSLGNVYASRLAEKDGTILKLQSRVVDNKYKVIAKTDTIYKVVKGNTIYKTQTKTITRTLKPEKIKYVPSFVSFLAWFGGIFLIIILIYITYRIIKSQLLKL